MGNKFVVTARLCALLWCVWLSACVSVPTQQTNPDAAMQIAQKQRQLLQLDNFTTTGGLSYWNKAENITARFNWQQADREFQIVVQPPLGMATLTVAKTASGATLQRGGAEVMQGNSVSSLLQQGLGLAVEVPMEQINLWIRGHAGASSERQFSDDGLLESLRYADSRGQTWKARFPKYTKFGAIDVPALIVAESGANNLRIVLKEWRSGTVAAQLNQKPETPQRLSVPGK